MPNPHLEIIIDVISEALRIPKEKVNDQTDLDDHFFGITQELDTRFEGACLGSGRYEEATLKGLLDYYQKYQVEEVDDSEIKEWDDEWIDEW